MEQKFKGAIIEVTVNSKPYIKHYGIIVYDENNEVKVLHNTPDFGKPTETTYADFMKSRSNPKFFSNILNTKTNEEIYNRFNNLKDRKFNLLTFNCEHFIDLMTGNKLFSEQKFQFIIIVIVLIILISILIYKIPSIMK